MFRIFISLAPSDPCTIESSWLPSALTTAAPAPSPKSTQVLRSAQMDGREVYKFAVRTVPKAVSEALEQAELPIEDVKYFLLHQANIRIIESVAKRLHQPMEKFPCNLLKCGNVSAASVPILLDNVHKHGMISGGDKIVLAGFGAGLTWGACAVEW